MEECEKVALKGLFIKTGVVFDGTAAYVCSATTYAELGKLPERYRQWFDDS